MRLDNFLDYETKLGKGNNETWLICGGRDFANQTLFDKFMFELFDYYGVPSVIIHGTARGADTMASELAKTLDINQIQFKPNWRKYRKAAGPIRNREMLSKGKPDRVIAFPGGVGTANMIQIARESGLDVIEV